jgi:hypothetical protein
MKIKKLAFVGDAMLATKKIGFLGARPRWDALFKVIAEKEGEARTRTPIFPRLYCEA